MLHGKHLSFKAVRQVQVKAETTTPGELRTTTDATGARVSASRGRRTLPKLEFMVDEDGAVLHGPQRGSYPFYATPNSNQNAINMESDAPFNSALERDLAASFQALHMRDFPSPPSPGDEEEEHCQQQEEVEQVARPSLTPQSRMKECVLNDTRATTLALKYDNAVGKFVCGSSIERFSGHTGVCRVLGSKKHTAISHKLKLGDLLRIGSVGLVVCELNRTTSEKTEEKLTNEQYEFLKENYLSLPLQQTFHPTERSPDDGEHEDKDHEHTLRVGDTSDEGESEEDKDRKGDRRLSDEDNNADSRHNNLPLGVAGTTGKRFCYICYDGDEDPDNNPLVAPCHCKGDTKYVHLDCLQRWNNNLDADGTNPNQKVCAVTNTDGLDVCSICKATYLTSVRLDDGRVVSLLAKRLPPPYVTFAVVTQHETRNRSTALTNTRFQLSFANMPRGQRCLTIGRSTTNNMTLRYRTVSQVHAKIQYDSNNDFLLTDDKSSNGTMLFLSKPLELDWGETMHVKIGRTILTLLAKKKWKFGRTGSRDDEEGEEGRASSPRLSALAGTAREYENRMSSPSSVARGHGFGRSMINDPSAELVAAPYPAQLPRTYTAPNVLNSRFNRSTPASALHPRPLRQRSLSSSVPMLRGDDNADALHVPSVFNVDELDPDESDTFATHAVQEPVILPASSTNFRDFAAENASPSLTSQLASQSIDSPNAHEELIVQQRGLYDLMDSFSGHGASPIAATSSPAGRLTDQD